MEYKFTEKEMLLASERVADYISGKDKGIPATEASKRIRKKLKKRK